MLVSEGLKKADFIARPSSNLSFTTLQLEDFQDNYLANETDETEPAGVADIGYLRRVVRSDEQHSAQARLA